MKKDNVIAILRWEADQVPRGLEQLEKITGNSTNPKSYRRQIGRASCRERV